MEKFQLLFFDGYRISQEKSDKEITIGLFLIALQSGAQTSPQAPVGDTENVDCGMSSSGFGFFFNN